MNISTLWNFLLGAFGLGCVALVVLLAALVGALL
jgi:hypothetical protein